MKNKYTSFLILIFIVGCGKSNRLEKKFYDSGQIFSETELLDDRRDGVYREYYESGKIAEISSWESGSKNGMTKFYHKNGKLKFIGNFKNNKAIDTVFYYYDNDEGIEEWDVYRDGEILDFCKYNKDGTIRENSRYPIFYAQKDTVKLGEEYSVEIRLGSRIHDRIIVVIGSGFDKNNMLLDTLAVIRDKDFVIKYSTKPNKLGVNRIYGLIGDVKITGNKANSETLPLEHEYFVTPLGVVCQDRSTRCRGTEDYLYSSAGN